jgi:DNA polymerase-1
MAVIKKPKTGWEFYEKTWRLQAETLRRMEWRGILIDPDICHREQLKAIRELEENEVLLNDWAGREVNWKSPKQIAALLYDEKGLPIPPIKGTLRAVQFTKEGERPTGEASIKHLADEFPEVRASLRILLQYKKLVKGEQFFRLLPEYVDDDLRVHTSFAASTVTGRLTSRNPNLQQMPQGIREAFIAKPGHVLICLDFSGLEWRILAHVLAHGYDDYSLIDEIERGINPHSATARKMGLAPRAAYLPTLKADFPQAYKAAKIINYSINYGKTGMGLGAQITDEHDNPVGKAEGERLLKLFYETNPNVAEFHRDIMVRAYRTGSVKSLLGRPRPIQGWPRWFAPHKWEPGQLIPRAGRQAINVIQNCAADIVSVAMIDCEFSPVLTPAKLLLQVHDELVFECPEDRAEDMVENAATYMKAAIYKRRKLFKCPLDVEGGYGYNWKEAGGK